MRTAYAYIQGDREEQLPAIEQYCHNKKYEIRKTFRASDSTMNQRKKLWEAIKKTKPGIILLFRKASCIPTDPFVFHCAAKVLEARRIEYEIIEWDLPWKTIPDDTKAAVEYIEFLVSHFTRSKPYWAEAITVQRSRRMGRYAPYGWKLDPDNPKQWIKNEEEQKFLNKMHDMHGLSVKKMVDYLNSLSPRGCRGTEWRELTVRRIMKREGMTGIKPAY